MMSGRIRFGVGRKLAAMLALPIVGLLFFAGSAVGAALGTRSEMAQVEDLTSLGVQVGNLVHETQKERGFTSGFLASVGAQFGAELTDQRTATDARLDELSAYLESFDSTAYGTDFERQLAGVEQDLSNLTTLRSGVDDLSLSAGEAVGSYTAMNGDLLDLIAHAATVSDVATVNRQVNAYVAFLQAKERAGIERALGSGAFTTGAWADGAYLRFADVVSQQTAYLHTFERTVGNEQLGAYEQAISAPVFAETENMRQILLASSGGNVAGVEGGAFFAAMTNRINTYKEVEDLLAANLSQTTQGLESDAQATVFRLGAVALAAIVSGALLAWAVGRRMLSGIREVAAAANGIAGGNIDQTITIQSSDEVGQAADAFRSMIEYLTSMARAASQLAEGDLTVEVQPRSDRDALGQAFVSMIAALRESIASTVTTAALVADSAAGLSQASNDSAQAATEVATAISLVAENTTQQTFAMQDVNETVAAIIEFVSQATAALGEVEDSAGTASGRADDGRQNVEEAIARMGKVTEAINTVASTIADLEQMSQDVGDVVALIRSISDQTNLLALNAAIEAARAGEQGRGFAVVAGEVKALAEQAGDSTDKIAEIIGRMRQGVQGAVAQMEHGQHEVAESNAVVVGAGQSFTAIAEAVDGVTGRVRSLGSAVSEIEASARTIGERADGLTDITESNSATSEQVAAASEEAAATSEEIGATAQEMTDSAAELVRVTSRFTLPA